MNQTKKGGVSWGATRENKPARQFFEKIDKTKNPLARPTNKKGEKTHIINTRKKRWNYRFYSY